MENPFKKEAALKCPRCRVRMEKINKGGVTIDVCRHCRGMWLDDEEIDKLIDLAKHAEKGQ